MVKSCLGEPKGNYSWLKRNALMDTIPHIDTIVPNTLPCRATRERTSGQIMEARYLSG